MADPAHERERTDFRIGSTGRTDPYDPDTLRGNPDAISNGSSDARDRTLGSLVKQLRDESTTLIRQEIALAKTELSEKASKIGTNAASIGVGAALAYAGALLLLVGLTITLYFVLDRIGLPNFWSGVLSFLIVGGGAALIGYGMIKKGTNAMKSASLVPEKTIDSLKEDKQWLTNQTK